MGWSPCLVNQTSNRSLFLMTAIKVFSPSLSASGTSWRASISLTLSESNSFSNIPMRKSNVLSISTGNITYSMVKKLWISENSCNRPLLQIKVHWKLMFYEWIINKRPMGHIIHLRKSSNQKSHFENMRTLWLHHNYIHYERETKHYLHFFFKNWMVFICKKKMCLWNTNAPHNCQW